MIKGFYVRNSDEGIYQKFQEICEEKDISMSQKIMEFIKTYVGNDPIRQTTIQDAGKPKTLPRYQTCEHSGKKITNAMFLCRRDGWRKVAVACDRCFYYALESKSSLKKALKKVFP